MSVELFMNPHTELLANAFVKAPANSVGIVGPKGSGKLRLAKHLCEKILNLKSNEFDFKVDVLDSSKQDGIDRIRELKKSLAIKAGGAGNNYKRAVIFKNFNTISVPAQNSILKLLEEPPLDTIIIVLVDAKNNVLPTITSRLQWIGVLPLSLEMIRKNYKDYEESHIKKAYLLSEGYIESFEENLKVEDTAIKLAVEDAKKVLKMKKAQRIAGVDGFANNQSYTPLEFLAALQKIYLTLIRQEINQSNRAQNKVLLGLEDINRAKESLNYNSNTKLVFTNLFYKI